MLIISRHVERVKVLGILPDRVKLGIEADSRFVILRDELAKGQEAS